MNQPPATPALPEMSYVTVEPKPLRPTEAQIKRRAHHLWVMRNGAPGNAALDWLQAELELTSELARRAGRIDRLLEPLGVPSAAPAPIEADTRVEMELKPDADAERTISRERHGSAPPASARRAA